MRLLRDARGHPVKSNACKLLHARMRGRERSTMNIPVRTFLVVFAARWASILAGGVGAAHLMGILGFEIADFSYLLVGIATFTIVTVIFILVSFHELVGSLSVDSWPGEWRATTLSQG